VHFDAYKTSRDTPNEALSLLTDRSV